MVHTYLCSPVAIHPSIVATASSRVSTLTGTPRTCGRGCTEPSSPTLSLMPLASIDGGFLFSVQDSSCRGGGGIQELNVQSGCWRRGGGDWLRSRGFTERTQFGLLATQPVEIAGDLGAVDRVHGDHQIRPIVAEELRPDDLLSAARHEPPVPVRIDVDQVFDLLIHSHG